MRILASVCLSVGLVGAFASAALAADPYAYPSEPPPSFGAGAWQTVASNWSGVYVGIQGGGGFGDIGDADFNGALLGGTLGVNGQFGSVVFGGEADGSWAPLEGSSGSRSFEMQALGTIRGRVGYAFDRFMAYGTGGLAFASVEQTSFPSETRMYFGWTAGAGVEVSLTQNLSAKLEYLYADLGDQDFPGRNNSIETSLTANIVRAGVNYRF